MISWSLFKNSNTSYSCGLAVYSLVLFFLISLILTRGPVCDIEVEMRKEQARYLIAVASTRSKLERLKTKMYRFLSHFSLRTT
jgi:hypothetical protein